LEVVYLQDVECPAIPVEMTAFKTSKARWAKGLIQTRKICRKSKSDHPTSKMEGLVSLDRKPQLPADDRAFRIAAAGHDHSLLTRAGFKATSTCLFMLRRFPFQFLPGLPAGIVSRKWFARCSTIAFLMALASA